MSVKLGATGVLALAGIAVGGLVLWRAWRTGQAAADVVAGLVTTSLNPASSDNVVNQGVEAIGRSITGNDYWNLGGAVYDWTHTDQADPTRNTAADLVNPASSGNAVNRAVSAAGQAITGNSSWTLGGWLYDLTHGDPKP